MGFNSKSRFGLALSGLGDINRDGYGGKNIFPIIIIYTEFFFVMKYHCV